MKSIKELRKICQNPVDIHDPKAIIEEKIARIFSVYLTKILLYTPLKADHVTMLMIFWGFIVGFIFSIGTYWYMLIGAIVWEFLLILDDVDGEIARYKKTPSLNGVFLDLIAHLTNLAAPFVGLTIGLYKLNLSIYILLAGFSASVFSILCLNVQPLKHHVVLKELVKYADKTVRIKSKNIQKKLIKETTEKKNSLKLFGRLINELYHGFSVIHIFLLAAIFNKLHWALFFYGLTFPLIWLAKLIYEYKIGFKPYEYLFKPYKK